MHNFSVEPDGMLNAGQGTLGKRTDVDVKNLDANMYEDVDTISLSDAVREDVWLMKLDVEGCEVRRVVAPLPTVLVRHSPLVMYHLIYACTNTIICWCTWHMFS